MGKIRFPILLLTFALFFSFGLEGCRQVTTKSKISNTPDSALKASSDLLHSNSLLTGHFDYGGYETGGSNYPMYDIGAYLNDPSTSNWEATTLRPVIATYHHNPAAVNRQIQSMCNSGMRKIGLIVWYAPFRRQGPDATRPDTEWAMHMVDSNSGSLSPQHATNLAQIIHQIVQAKKTDGNPCYDELQFRFAPQGIASDIALLEVSTSTYSQYLEESFNFIVSTRNIIEETITSSNGNIRRLYDLGAEMPRSVAESGNTRNMQYLEDLWTKYASIFGTADTYGFSFAVGASIADRVIDTVKMHVRTGHVPSQYAFDIYGDVYRTVKAIVRGLQSNNLPIKPFLIQEAGYNDPQTAQDVQRLLSEGVQIRTVMQWPISMPNLFKPNSSEPRHYDRHYCESYDAYSLAPTAPVPTTPSPSPSPVIAPTLTPSLSDIGIGCTDNQCIWLFASGVERANATIELRSQAAPGGAIIATIPNNQLTFISKDSGQFEISFRIPSSVVTTARSPGVLVWVVNHYSNTNTRNTTPKAISIGAAPAQTTPAPAPTLVSTLTPSLSEIGVGCTDNQCIWLFASGVERSNATIELRNQAAPGGAIIATIPNNQLTFIPRANGEYEVSFRIPSGVVSTARSPGILVWMVNHYPSTNTWNATPKAVAIP